MHVQVDTRELDALLDKVSKMPKEASKALTLAAKRSEGHVKKFASQQIQQHYSIKAGDVRGGAVDISTKADVMGISIVYKGRTLTLAHFPFIPTRVIHRKPVEVTIKDRMRKIMNNRTFVAPTGTKNASKIQAIPFMRIGRFKRASRSTSRYAGQNFVTKGRGQKRKSDGKNSDSGRPIMREVIKPVHTLSIPQMLAHPEVMQTVQDDAALNMLKNFESAFDAVMKGYVRGKR